MARKAKRDLTIEQQLARGPIDLPFLALVMLLTAVGLIMVLSASYASAMYNLDPAIDTEGDPLYFFKRQFVFALIGVFAMFVISKIDYQHFRWMSVFVLGASIVLMLMVFIPYFGRSGGGALRWVKIGPIRFQPSEIAKVGIILYFAARLSKRGIQLGPPKDKKWNRRTLLGRTCERLDNIGFLELVPYGAVLLVVLGLIVKEPHVSGALLVAVGAAAVLLVSGISLWWFIGLGGAGAGLLAVMYITTGYVRKKIALWLDPWSANPQVEGFQFRQGMYSIASGGLLGRGLGNSNQKYGFVPEPENDMVFAIVVEELGLVGGFLILLLFALLILRGYWIALHARDKFGMLTVVGLITLLAFQVFFNIGVVTNLLPNTGISLPFFSYGGTALMIHLAEMGIILSISRQIPAPRKD